MTEQEFIAQAGGPEGLVRQCAEEEARWCFDSFSRDDVWDLGCALVEAAGAAEGPLAVEIDLNGLTVFSYYPAGTGVFNRQWLDRKRNTVRTTEKSSLHIFAELLAKQDTMLHDMRLDPMEYADCGGGFPLRLRGGCVAGFIGVSGLPHFRDHQVLLDGLARFWKKRGKA